MGATSHQIPTLTILCSIDKMGCVTITNNKLLNIYSRLIDFQIRTCWVILPLSMAYKLSALPKIYINLGI